MSRRNSTIENELLTNNSSTLDCRSEQNFRSVVAVETRRKVIPSKWLLLSELSEFDSLFGVVRSVSTVVDWEHY